MRRLTALVLVLVAQLLVALSSSRGTFNGLSHSSRLNNLIDLDGMVIRSLSGLGAQVGSLPAVAQLRRPSVEAYSGLGFIGRNNHSVEHAVYSTDIRNCDV